MKLMLAAAMAAMMTGTMGKQVTVVQRDGEFDVKDVTIAVGDEVVFRNQDEVTHEVFSFNSGIAFNIIRQKPGESSTVKFDKPGTGVIRCSIHPKMKLNITVK